MKVILDNELEVKVFIYDTEEERDANIIKMKELGFLVKRSGVINISPESTVTAYNDDDNWKPFAEFAKIREKFKTKEPMSFETDMYYFNVYNPTDE